MLKLPHWNPIIEIMNTIEKLRDYCERRGYEVCSRMGDRMGLRPGVVRLYFIYISFLSFGSPIIIYMFLAFWIRIKGYLKPSRRSVLDL